MTLVDIAALVFGLAAAYVFLTSVPDLWAGRSVHEFIGTFTRLWPADPALSRALVRALPTAAACALVWAVAYGFDRLAPDPAVGTAEVLRFAARLVLAGLATLGLVWFVTIILWNRPKRLVPPVMRADRGMLQRPHGRG